MPKPQENNPDPTPPATPMPKVTAKPFSLKRAIRWALRATGLLLLCVALLLLLIWSVLAIYYTDLSSASPRAISAGLFAIAAIAVAIFIRPRRRYAVAALLVMFSAVLAWYFSRSPSNEREWAPEVARVAWADVQGSKLVMHNVRNFEYRSEADFTQIWEDRTYDLDQLQTADLILVHWGSEKIAHVIASFGFSDGRYLDVSIETRREKFETVSAIESFFRQYELSYIFSDERDVIRLRTNYRHEDVYIFRTRTSPTVVREIFISYLESANSLRQKPEWYNALTTNCATSVLPHIRAGGKPGKWSTDVLFSGYAARQGYRNGMLADGIPFEELEKRSYVNPVAVAAGNGPDFSQKIRANLPDPRVK